MRKKFFRDLRLYTCKVIYMKQERERRIEGKVALITGAASGIGESIARRFAGEGARVVVVDCNAEDGARVCDAITQAGGEASFVATDVADELSVERACDAASAQYGGIDILVNSAAVFIMKDLEATADDWRRSLVVNVMGTALACKHAARQMKRRGGGAIVNLGSISAFVAQPRLTTYSATKAAVVQMTRNIAMDLAPYRIRANCVCPGPVWTPALRRTIADNAMDNTAFMADECPKILLGRIGEPDEVAAAVLFLASDEASYITGTSLLVDGGYCAR